MSFDYRSQPSSPNKPIGQMKRYFYTILFIKSYVYNVKGQAIIFRRKSLESLMKLINDFDETYLHSSYEHSYQNRALSQGNVDFLVRYTDNLDDVISLIDQNAYVIKLSWQAQRVAQPYPPQMADPMFNNELFPFASRSNYSPANIDRIVNQAVSKAIGEVKDENKSHLKRVKITNIDAKRGFIEVRQWDDVNKKYLTLEQFVDVSAYSKFMPDWRPGDDALLLDGKYLQRINDTPNYRRVKVWKVDQIDKGYIEIYNFDDKTKKATSSPYRIDIKAYCYDGKTPSWHEGDDALLFDNKYLQKLDVPDVPEGVEDALSWGDASDVDYVDYASEGNYNPDEDGYHGNEQDYSSNNGSSGSSSSNSSTHNPAHPFFHHPHHHKKKCNCSNSSSDNQNSYLDENDCPNSVGDHWNSNNNNNNNSNCDCPCHNNNNTSNEEDGGIVGDDDDNNNTNNNNTTTNPEQDGGLVGGDWG